MEGAGELGASGATCTITLTSAESWNPLTEPVSYVDAANRALSGRNLSVRSDVAIRRLKGGAYPADDVPFGYAAGQAGLSGGYPARAVPAPRCSVADRGRSGATRNFDDSHRDSRPVYSRRYTAMAWSR